VTSQQMDMIDALMLDVTAEVDRAEARYGPPASAAESYGVLAEEMAELLDAIRAHDFAAIILEATQVSAVALRLAEWGVVHQHDKEPRI
jgi:NTP pyrophosphatase (non-canonical NTP hydrolase)